MFAPKHTVSRHQVVLLPAVIVVSALLSDCARSEDSSFAAQAVRRGDDCNSIAAGSAMDAYGHHVGPATEIYKYVYQDCLVRQQSKSVKR